MSTQHAKFVALAKRLIPINGRDISIVSTSYTGDSWDPNTSATSAQTVKALNLDFHIDQIGSPLVKSTDKLYLFDADAVITIKNRLIDGASNLEIIYIKPVMIGENLIITRVFARA